MLLIEFIVTLPSTLYLKYLLTEPPIYQRDGKNIEELLPWNVEKGFLS